MNLLKYSAILLLFFGCKTQNDRVKSYDSENLKIEALTKNTFVHTSYLSTQDFGNVPCNGMIVIDNNEAIIYDTPAGNAATLELINWVESVLNCKIKAVVATHFHVDCIGGLSTFHQKGIPSFANNLTIELALVDNEVVPENGFDKYFEHEIGNLKVISDFQGEGHTRDNIIGYLPEEKVLFGGCLIKGMNAGKGNLEDATVSDWSKTVEKIKNKYPNIEFVIPGHGKAGGTELLDYTIKKFLD